jgi:hypothetical protein
MRDMSPLVERLESRRLMAMVFPSDSGVVNVTDYGAVPNDGLDDTAAIQAAIDAFYDRTVYFPAGTYNVSDTIYAKSGGTSGTWRRTYLQGAGEADTIIKLANNDADFQSTSTPRPVVRWQNDNADANAFGDGFRNAMSDMTVDVGSGNPGAVGVKWTGHNQSFMRNITIKSSDASRAGRYGLDLTLVSPGPTHFRGLDILGFDYGIMMKESKGLWFTDLTLENQRQYGIWNERQIFAIEKLTSTNSVPVYYSNRRDGTTNGWGQVQIIGATLTGGASTAVAVDNGEGGGLYVRDLTTSGYGTAVKSLNNETSTTTNLPGGTVVEFVSHAARELFASPDTSLKLAIEDTPAITHDALSLWVNVKTHGATGNGATDDTTAIQAALNAAAANGKTTVYFPKGTYKISGTLTVTGGVKRVYGFGGAKLTYADPLKSSSNPVFRAQHTGAYLAIDHFEIPSGYGSTARLVRHDSTQPLIMRNLKLDSGRPYENLKSGNKLFIEDVVSNWWVFSNNQQVWARQINTEPKVSSGHWGIKNQGATVWLFGQKTEDDGLLIETTSGGRTELLAGLVDGKNRGTGDPPAFVNVESSHALSYVNINTIYEPQIRETRGGVTLEMTGSQLVTKQYARMMPLYTGYVPAPIAPAALMASAQSSSQINVTWTDNSSNETGFSLERKTGSAGTWAEIAALGANATSYSDTGPSAGTTYFYRVRATNSAGSSAYSNEASATTSSASPTLLSQGKPATASSVINSTRAAEYAFDGNTTSTRWASQWADNQWIQVDLGAVYSISTVKLYWEAAYASSFKIQVSNEGSTWIDIYSTTAGTGGVQELSGLSGSGRYVRMLGLTRATGYGFSLWEMQVFGS